MAEQRVQTAAQGPNVAFRIEATTHHFLGAYQDVSGATAICSVGCTHDSLLKSGTGQTKPTSTEVCPTA
jgi:hypothetical protein